MEINPKPVVCLIVEEIEINGNIKILLQKRDKDVKYSGLWELPQGKIQIHEDFLSASRRELKEETTLDLILIDSIHALTNEYILDSKISLIEPLILSLDLSLGFIGIGIVIKSCGIPQNTLEASSHSYLSKDDIDNLITNNKVFPLDVPIIHKYFNGKRSKYLEINKEAYNLLAQEYKRREAGYIQIDKEILTPFFKLIENHFSKKARILDLGCGSGLNLSMIENQGYVPIGLDFSIEMLIISQKTCPNAILINDDFLECKLLPNSFEGIIARAFIHLFTKEDSILVLKKIYDILIPNGIFFIATTVSNISKEGFFIKEDYPLKVIRYRKLWEDNELEKILLEIGFKIHMKFNHHNETWNKYWVNLICIKQS